MKEIIEDILVLGTLLAVGYVVLLWGAIGEALAG